MDKVKYNDKLLDPRWQKKRLEIFERDNWTCQFCGKNKHTLHVHHIEYKPDTEPWDYPNDLLLTLCEYCHQTEYETRAIAEQRLIAAFKRFSASTVDFLADTIEKTKPTPCEEFQFAMVVDWAIRDPETYTIVENRLWESIHASMSRVLDK